MRVNKSFGDGMRNISSKKRPKKIKPGCHQNSGARWQYPGRYDGGDGIGRIMKAIDIVENKRKYHD